jgi:hypothetical protein
MTATPVKNPVEKRLEQLADHWNRLAENREARLIRWLVPAEAVELLEGFFELQRHDWDKGAPDLFINFSVPFRHLESYSLELTRRLVEIYQASGDEFAQEGIRHDWQPPSLTGGNTAAAWLACLASFQRHYASYFEYLVPVLMPAAVSNIDAYQIWLGQALTLGIPEQVRFTVIDLAEAPQLDILAARFPRQVQTVAPDLNINAVIREILAQAGGTGAGVAFRRLFIELTGLVASGDLAPLRAKAVAALAIARQENWHDQQVVVHMVEAAAYFKAQRRKEAIGCYRAARAAAEAACREDHPAARHLLAQALFGEAAVQVAEENFAAAAELYGQAAPWTRAIPEAGLTVEALRMSAYCCERQGAYAEAWQRGWQALNEAEQMEPEQRSFTALPHAAEGLLRVAKKKFKPPEAPVLPLGRPAAGCLYEAVNGTVAEQRALAVEVCMVALLGENWKAALQPQPSVSEETR